MMTTACTELASLDQPRIFSGTSGWTYDDWKGRFYPEKLPKKRWFEHYASQFSCVEVNATFYRFFKDETYQNWKENAPQGFGYVLKVPRLITHQKALVETDEDIRSFYRSCTLLGDKFEMLLLQVAPHIPYDLQRLENALHAFPDPTRVAVEFRRPEWYSPAALSLLREAGATICNVDSPQHELTDHLTSERAYLRLHGRTNWYAYNYSEAELRSIAQRTIQLIDRGVKRAYIFFNNDYNANAPANALYLCSLLNIGSIS